MVKSGEGFADSPEESRRAGALHRVLGDVHHLEILDLGLPRGTERRRGCCRISDEGAQRAVHVLDLVLEGQVVRLVAERLLDFHSDEVDAPKHEHVDEGGSHRCPVGLHQVGRHRRDTDGVCQQHYTQHLRAMEWELHILHLADRVHLHQALGHLIEHARYDRRRRGDNARIYVVNDDALNPMHNDFDLDTLQLVGIKLRQRHLVEASNINAVEFDAGCEQTNRFRVEHAH
mmetsp:Transcript_124814/g.358444  ORF Transcript_124814/g.358444 Transcript_124814/m.358444 type:complete len:231 (+) Transcript_124814:739-1431(+)